MLSRRDLVEDIYARAFTSFPNEVLQDAKAAVRENLKEAYRVAAMNPASRFSLRKPKVHLSTDDAADQIAALNAATPIAAEYAVATLYEAEMSVGANDSSGGRRANLKK